MMQWVVFSLQEVKSQPQNILMDAIFDDPWTNAYRLELVGFSAPSKILYEYSLPSFTIPIKFMQTCICHKML